MEIRKLIFITRFIFGSFTILAGPHDVGTPKSVKMFISNLETLSQLSVEQNNEADNLLKQNIGCFYGEFGCEIDSKYKKSSELAYLGVKEISSPVTYCNSLFRMLYEERTLRLEHEILYTEPVKMPDTDGKDELYFYDTKIKKTCIYNNQTLIIWQSFEVEPTSGLIDGMSGYNTMPSSWLRNNVGNIANQSVTKEPQQSHLPNNTGHVESVKKMTEQEYLRLAARYYTSGDYATAGATYKELTTVYPENAEGWFRLALIVRYKTKWSKKAYKNPQQIAITFMKKASGLATGKLKSKADNALFYWENPNYM